MPTLKFDPKAPHIIVGAKIQSIYPETATLILDTGASAVVLPRRLASMIGLNIDPKRTVKTTTATTVEIVPEVTIPEISVLGKTAKNVRAIIKDLPPQAPADGLLGLSFLKHFKLTVDFKKGLLKLE